MSHNLTELPVEVLTNISKYLAPGDLVHAKVNHFLNGFFEDDTLHWGPRVKYLAMTDYHKQPNQTWKQLYIGKCANLEHLAKQLKLLLEERGESVDDLYEIRDKVCEEMSNIIPKAITTPALLNTFLGLYPNIDQSYRLGYSLLLWFTAYADPNGVKFLLEAGAGINEESYDDPLLFIVAQMCNNENKIDNCKGTIKVLVEKEPTLLTNRYGEDNETILKYMENMGFLSLNTNEDICTVAIAKFLISLGASVSELSGSSMAVLRGDDIRVINNNI
jgi:hypothetical protein